MAVRTSNEMDHWLRFFLTGVIETAEKGKHTFDQIAGLRASYEKRTLLLGKRAKLAQELLVKMYSNPILSPRDVEAELQITAATANSLLRAMEKENIIVESTGRSRDRLYVLHEYLAIFRV